MNIFSTISNLVSTIDFSTIKVLFKWIIEVLPIVSIIISILALLHSKRTNINKYVTQSRLTWVSEIRKLLTQFLIEYTSPNCREDELRKLKISIDLYLTYTNSMYDQLINELDYCMSNAYDNDPKTLKRITTAFQIPINQVWRSIKNESGKTIANKNIELKKIYEELAN